MDTVKVGERVGAFLEINYQKHIFRFIGFGEFQGMKNRIPQIQLESGGQWAKACLYLPASQVQEILDFFILQNYQIEYIKT